MLKKLPLPICGVALGFAALGNLLEVMKPYGIAILADAGIMLKIICGIISAVIILLYTIKILTDFAGLKEDLKNPIMASTFGTYSMSIMLLGGYIFNFFNGLIVGKIIWLIGVVLHIIIMIYFTKEYVLKFDLKKVFASWYIIYVGIVVASINANAMNMNLIGTIAFWFGFISLIVLLFVVTKRYIKYKEVPDMAKPVFCIYAAPTSLCLAGYMACITNKQPMMILFLTVLSLIIYIIAFINLIKCLKLPFFPSYAAFTFPFVISAICIKLSTMNFYKDNAVYGSMFLTLKNVFAIQTLIAAVLCVYVLIRYLVFIFKK